MVLRFWRTYRLELLLCVGVATLLACTTLFLNVNDRFSTAVRSDGRGYYVYLPALFIHHDLTMSWTEPLQKADPSYSGSGEWYGLSLVSGHTYLDKYPIGLAILWTPFFLLAHIFSLITSKPATGYSGWYQGAIALAGVIYTTLGCLILFKVLRRYFSLRISYAVVITLLLGTNLLSYATYDNDFTHIYSFCLIAAVLYVLPLWYRAMSYKLSALLAVLLALIILVRQTDTVVLLVVAFWGITSQRTLRQRLRLWWRQRRKLLMMAGIGALVCSPQLIYWHTVAGKWFLFSYRGETFNFAHPQLLNILFSSDRGVFFWAPVLLLAVIGVVLMWQYLREWFWPIVIFFPIWLYIISSWHSWQFGVSYGHRAFIDFFPLFGLAIGLVFARIRTGWPRLVLGIFVGVCIVMNLFLAHAYWAGGLPGAATTLQQYSAVWHHEIKAAIVNGFTSGILGLAGLVLLTLGPVTYYFLTAKAVSPKRRSRSR